MYREQHVTQIVPSGVALPMEGEARPHFFTGVATIVFKLFQHVPADYAIFESAISNNLPFCAKWWVIWT